MFAKNVVSKADKKDLRTMVWFYDACAFERVFKLFGRVWVWFVPRRKYEKKAVRQFDKMTRTEFFERCLVSPCSNS